MQKERTCPYATRGFRPATERQWAQRWEYHLLMSETHKKYLRACDQMSGQGRRLVELIQLGWTGQASVAARDDAPDAEVRNPPHGANAPSVPSRWGQAGYRPSRRADQSDLENVLQRK